MSDLIPPMLIKLQADVQGLKTGLAQAESAIKGVDNSVQTASNGMTNFVGKLKQIGATMGIAFASTQVLQFGKDVIAQAMEAEAQQQRLYQLMKVGTGATDEQVAALNAQAEALEKVGVVTGGNITQTQSQLATFNLQYDTIQRLTPAILDYVTAEKGANASADEFKQMTNGLAQALNGNFGSLTRVGFVLDDHTKKLISSGTEAERSAAIVDVLNSTYKGFNEELRNTPAGQMQALKNDFDALKTELGKKLLPALLTVSGFLTNTFIPALRSLGKFIQENADALKIYTGIVLGGAAAFYVVRGAIIATRAVMVVYTAVTKAMAAGHTLAAIATLNFRGAMMMLNMAIRANPIGAIITALTVLGAAFVFAWKKSETFRGIVIKGVQIILTGFGYLVQGIGKFIGMLSKVPGMGWAKGIADGAKKASDEIKATSKNLSDLKSNVKAGYGEGAFTYGSGKGTGSGGGGGGGGGGGLDDKEKKKLEGYKKDVKNIYKDMNEIIADAQEKAQEALESRNEKMFEAHKDYDEKVLRLKNDYSERIVEIDKNYNDTLADLQYRYNDVKEKAEKRYNDTVAEAEKRYKERSLEIEKAYAEKKADLIEKNQETIQKATDAYNKKYADSYLRHEDAVNKATETAAKKKINIEKDYADKVIDLRKNFENKIASLQDTAAKKSSDLIKSASDKQANIIQQSMDRLRNAFASKTGFDLGEALSGGSPEEALDKLKKSLEQAKKLQANAAALAGLGYSQVFIEEIVKQGPEAGNKIAEALKDASPDATKELQSLYNEVQNVSNRGLDALAETMNQGGKLATEELTNAYNAVSADLTEALSQVQQTLNQNLADANASYLDAMAEAKTNRDEKLAEAQIALLDALGTAKKALDDSIADALETMNEAVLQANKTLSEGLAEAEKNRTEDLAKAKKDLDDAIADAKKTLTDAMAEAQKDLDKGLADAAKALAEAREKAQKALNEGLAEAQKTLQESLLEAQKNYEKAIDEINKSTQKKLEDLKAKLAEVAALMAALSSASASGVVSGAPTIPTFPKAKPPYTPTPKTDPTSTLVVNNNITATAVDPYDVHLAVISGVKYGAAVILAGGGGTIGNRDVMGIV